MRGHGKSSNIAWAYLHTIRGGSERARSESAFKGTGHGKEGAKAGKFSDTQNEGKRGNKCTLFFQAAR